MKHLLRHTNAVCIFWLSTAILFVQIATAQSPTPTAPPFPELTPTAQPTSTPLPTPLPVLFQTQISSNVLREGGAPIRATIVSSRAYESDVTFRVEPQFFAPVPNTILQLPAAIVLRAGQTSVSFSVGATDDVFYYFGRGTVRLNFTAAGAAIGTANPARFTYVENDVPTLRLSLDSDTIRAGNVEGGRVGGILSSNAPNFGSGLTVQISSSDASLVYAPSSVDSPTGVAFFTLIGRDTPRLQSPRRVRITVSARGFAPATAEITVLPLRAPQLRLRVQPPVVDEGETSQVMVSRDGDTSQATNVKLLLNGTLVRAVTLAPGQRGVTVPVNFAPNGVGDNNTRGVSLVARAEGAVSTQILVLVRNTEPQVLAGTDAVLLLESISQRANLILRLTRPLSRAVSVRVRRFGSRVRFVDTPSQTLVATFPAGQTRLSVPFQVQNDAIFDRDRDGFTPEEGFAVSQPFAALPDAETKVAVTIVDDEAPIALRLSANQTVPDDNGAYPEVMATLLLQTASSSERKFAVAIRAEGVSSDFELVVAPGQRSASFTVPGDFRSPLVRITASEIGGTLRASALLSRAQPEGVQTWILAENGGRQTIEVRRADASRAQTFVLSTSTGSIQVPSQVSFRAGQKSVVLPVLPLDNDVRDNNRSITVLGTPGEGGQEIALAFLTIVDDDTDAPSRFETPSDARIVAANLVSYDSTTRSLVVRIRFSEPVSIQAAALQFDSFINGRSRFGSADDEEELAPDFFELRITDPALVPGARLTLVPNTVADEEGRFVPATPISFIVPSNTAT